MTKFKCSKLTQAILLSCSVAISHSVFSQEQEDEKQNNNAKLEVIEVTSQKRTQTLQEVPATITALPSDEIAKYGIDDLFEIADLVPGMVFSRAPDDGLALTLRGLGTPARTQSFDQSVALFQDGMFVGKGRMYSAAFFDVERIEVIKGTQSTLLGKNTSLGAISIVSRKPTDEFEASLKGGFEVANGGWNLDTAINVPVSDNFSLRIAGYAADQDGWVENIATGRDVPEDSDRGLRITGLYTPSDTLTITGAYQHSTSERIGNAYQYVDNGNYFTDDVIDIIGEAQLDDTKNALCDECKYNESYHDTTVDSFTLTIEKEVGELMLTSVTSTANYDILFYDDFDFGNAFDEVTYVTTGEVNYYSTYFKRVETYEQLSQELRLASEGRDNFDFMTGLFYFKSDWDSLEEQFFNTPNFPPGDISGEIFNGSFGNDFQQKTETFSVFAQSDIYLSDDLTLAVGLRYTDESKDVDFDRIQGDLQTLWNTVINPPFESSLDFEDSFLNGNASLSYNFDRDTTLYASYGVGSKTGGFAESAEVTSGDPSLDVSEGGARVKSEEAHTYEAGAKLVLLDSSVNLNAAVFYTEIFDFQETSFLVTESSAGFLTQNVDVESTGFELDTLYQINDDWRLSAAVTYADSVHKDDGSDLAQAPKWTGNAGYSYISELGFKDLLLLSSGTLRYRDEMVSQINETYSSDSLTTLDFSIGIEPYDGVWNLRLSIQNITNARSADFSGPPAAPIGAILGAPTGDQGITAETLNQQRMINLQFAYTWF
ncbi:TonB-dependent receptor [Alteromonas portus]|uniref:TonB-dependent receptor n=1 Tax=Alteromonas portus TaxID=2565549 RepID=UPI003BF7EB2F